MFLIDGYKLDKNDHPDQWQFYQEKINEIQNSGKKNYIFKAYSNDAKNVDERGRVSLIKNRNKAIPVTSSFKDNHNGIFLNNEWTYVSSLSSCRRLESGAFIPTKPTYSLKHMYSFSTETSDVDIIFFLKYICSDPQVQEVDFMEINKKAVEEEMLLSEVKTLIFGAKSPLNPEIGGEEPLRNIAKEIGVSGSVSDDIYTLMKNISDYVQASHANGANGYAEFIKLASKYTSNVESSNTINMAIDRGILYYEDNIWKLRSRGGVDEIVLSIPKSRDDKDAFMLIDFVLKNGYWLEEIKQALENPTPIIPPKADRGDLMDKIISLNLGWKKGNLNTFKTDKLEEILERKLENKTTPK